MRYLVLACDYDGTIAHHGEVNSATRSALEKVAAADAAAAAPRKTVRKRDEDKVADRGLRT